MFELRPNRRQREMDLFERMAQSFQEMFEEDFTPSLSRQMQSFRADVKETKDAYIVQADLPGFKKEDITVDLENNYLTIRAERHDAEEEKEGDRIIRSERHYGSFTRRFYVNEIDENAVEASLKDGVLTIELPKKELDTDEKKRIDIK